MRGRTGEFRFGFKVSDDDLVRSVAVQYALTVGVVSRVELPQQPAPGLKPNHTLAFKAAHLPLPAL
jgi:hypothetical protein